MSADIKDNKIFPRDYTPYWADRQTMTKRSGGVFVPVKNSLVCAEQPQFRTNCEVIWIKFEIVGAQPLYIAVYCKPNEDDLGSLEKIFIHDSGQGEYRQECTGGPVYECFTESLDDFNLVQMVTQPIRQDHVLNLCKVDKKGNGQEPIQSNSICCP